MSEQPRVRVGVSVPRSAGRALLALLLLALARVEPAAAVHPFYERLEHLGASAYAQGDYDRAAENLRLAAFGMLDEPDRLIATLAQLALAQNAARQAPAALATLGRILDLERRFGVYAAAALPGDVGADLEQMMIERLEVEQLQQVPVFESLAAVKLSRQLSALGPAQRRERLAALLEQQPSEPRWARELAALELESGNPSAAVASASRVLELEPSDGEARCLRGRALELTNQCALALEDLASCPAAAQRRNEALAWIRCLDQTRRFDELAVTLEALPPEIRTDRAVRKIERQANRERARLAAAAARARQVVAPPQVAGDLPTSVTVPAEAEGAAADADAAENRVDDPADVSTPPAAEPPGSRPPASQPDAPDGTLTESELPTPEPSPCETGILAALQGRCAAALEQLEACPELSLHPRAGVELAACLVALGDGERAAEILAGLDPAAAPSRRFRRVSRRVEKLLAEQRSDEATVREEPVETAAPRQTQPVEGEAELRPPSDGVPAPVQARPDLEAIKRAVSTAASATELAEPLRQACEVADRFPDWREAQYLAAESAYRASNWELAARYFRRGGQPPTARPELLFYFAIALHETGDAEGARRALLEVLPLIRRTPFVNRYAEKILGSSDPGG